jgi:hypothetical protein
MKLDDKGLHIRRRVCAQLEPENILALCKQLSQTLYTISRHISLLCARNQAIYSCRQFLRDSLTYLHIMIADKIIVGNVAAYHRLFFETRKLDVA